MKKKPLMSQDEIKFYNMRIEHEGGWLRESPFKSAGNVIHWIKVYHSLSIADTIQIGSNEITYWSKKLASFKFDEVRNMPIFEFEDSHIENLNIAERIKSNQTLYLNMLDVFDFKNQMFKAEFKYIQEFTDWEFIQELNKGFDNIDRIHDWRNYINSFLIEIWDQLTFREKIIVFVKAYKLANDEEYD